MKRLLSLLFAAALLLLLATPVLADGLPTTISGTDPVVDRADLLTFSEEAALRTNANDIEYMDYEGMTNAQSKDLLPSGEDLGFDINMHFLRFAPGASHGYLETHIQQYKL